MSQLSAEAKHHILLEYRADSPGHSFSALASLHNIPGGKRTVQRWYQQWDGTERSLQRKPVAGRPRALTRQQVSRHIRAPILAANRAHRPIHYTTLLPAIEEKTHKDISLRTVQRYGEEVLHGKDKHTIKRTENECK
jgi:transposase